MANSNLFMGLKEIIYSMYDSNGNERIVYYEPLSKLDLSEARLELLRNICDLVLNTNILSEYSKIYIKNRNIKLKNVVEEVNRINRDKMKLVKVKTGHDETYEVGGEVTYNHVVSKIQYDQKRLVVDLGGSDIIVNILFYPSKSIEDYQLRVSRLLEKYRVGGNLRDKLTVKIGDSAYSKTYNGNFMDKYKDILYTYLESTRLEVEKQLNENKEFVGYFNHLISGINSEDSQVLQDRRELLDLLNGSSTYDIIKVQKEEEKSVEDKKEEPVVNEKDIKDKAIAEFIQELLNSRVYSDTIRTEELFEVANRLRGISTDKEEGESDNYTKDEEEFEYDDYDIYEGIDNEEENLDIVENTEVKNTPSYGDIFKNINRSEKQENKIEDTNNEKTEQSEENVKENIYDNNIDIKENNTMNKSEKQESSGSGPLKTTRTQF